MFCQSSHSEGETMDQCWLSDKVVSMFELKMILSSKYPQFGLSFRRSEEKYPGPLGFFRTKIKVHPVGSADMSHLWGSPFYAHFDNGLMSSKMMHFARPFGPLMEGGTSSTRRNVSYMMSMLLPSICLTMGMSGYAALTC